MKPAPFTTIDWTVEGSLMDLIATPDKYPLSGYLAGCERGGYYVCALEDKWAHTFHVKHAIACNSATSGLLASAFAIGLKRGDEFVASPMTMSATVAAPMFTGAKPLFVDVEDEMFSIPPNDLPYDRPVFATNLFGGTGWLKELRRWCDHSKTYLVEDNAQAPFAMERDRYAGTIGHIGVWSLNIHKPLQCGEGGIITTDDDDLAYKLRSFINHGEVAGGPIGLNLRMPELCAAVALNQITRGVGIVHSRIAQAEAILDAIGEIPGLRHPVRRQGCRHVFYTIPFLWKGDGRGDLCERLRERGVPVVNNYVAPLYRLPAFKKFARDCPVAEDLHSRRLFYIENCGWDFSDDEIRKIGDAFKFAVEGLI